MSSITDPNQQQDLNTQLIVDQIHQILNDKMQANIMLNSKYEHFITQLLNQKQLIITTANKIYDDKIQQLLNQLNTISNKNIMITDMTNTSTIHSNHNNNIQTIDQISGIIPINNIPISLQTIPSTSLRTSRGQSSIIVKDT